MESPKPTVCIHVWEHIWSVNGVDLDAKHTDGNYVVWCPSCGSFGKSPCRGRGLEQDKTVVTSTAYEDPYRSKPSRPVLRSRRDAINERVL